MNESNEKSLKVDKQGNIKEEAIKKHLTEAFKGESWLTPQMDRITSKCLVEARNATVPGLGDGKDPGACNPSGIKLGHCVFKEIQMSCPANQIKDQKGCARIMEKLQKNDYFVHHHGHLYEDH